MKTKMKINEIVFHCQSDNGKLEELLEKDLITREEYSKVKLILSDPDLRRLSVDKYMENRKAEEKSNKRKTGIWEKVVVILLIIGLVVFGYRKCTSTAINLEPNVYIKIDENKFSGEADANDIIYYNNIDYYDAEANYDQMISKFEASGLDNNQAQKLIPTYDSKTSEYLKELNFQPTVSKESKIMNGDKLDITFNYDRKYAFIHNLKITGNKQSLNVSSLKEHITKENYEKANTAQLKELCDDYLSNEEFENNVPPSYSMFLSNYSSCQIAIEKEGNNLYLMRSAVGEKLVQGKPAHMNFDFYITLNGYIQGNKYYAEPKGEEERLEYFSEYNNNPVPTTKDYYFKDIE